MSELENRRENPFYHRGAELRDVGAETREKQLEAQEKKMAARERVEQVSKEVKSTQKQMQNILANMQQVIKAVQAIRAQLALNKDDSIPSVERDKKTVSDLQKRLAGLRGELSDLRQALLVEEIADIHEEGIVTDEKLVEIEAQRRVKEVMKALGVEE